MIFPDDWPRSDAAALSLMDVTDRVSSQNGGARAKCSCLEFHARINSGCSRRHDTANSVAAIPEVGVQLSEWAGNTALVGMTLRTRILYVPVYRYDSVYSYVLVYRYDSIYRYVPVYRYDNVYQCVPVYMYDSFYPVRTCMQV